MQKIPLAMMMGGCALCLVACSGGGPAESKSDAEPVQLAETIDGSDAPDGSITNASSPTAASAAEAEMSAAPPATASSPGDLTAYVGKFPFEAVAGVAWHDHPMVTAGIRKTVTDPAVVRAMQSPGGPSAPIGTYEGKVGSWGCQQHNCGNHQWAVLVDPGSGATDVCYHNAEQAEGSSRWFLADGSVETRSGNCLVV